MQITTERLIIRSALESDDAFVLKLLNEPTYISMIRDSGVRDLEGARNHIRERYIKSYSTHGYGMYVITSKIGEYIGIIGIINRGLDVPDLGFAVLQMHAGKGYTQEASRRLLVHAKHDLKIPRLSAITTSDNHASTKVILNLGFQFIKVMELPDADKKLNYYELELK